MTRAYVGLGANLGDPLDTLVAAVTALRHEPGLTLIACSAVYRSAPVEAHGPDFLNAVCVLETGAHAEALLERLQGIELQFGRERPYRNAPRTLDLDLLLFGDERHNSARLTLPHPRLHERAFVLRPLADLAPRLRLRLPDGSIASISNRLEAVSDQRIERACESSVFVDKTP